MITSIEELRLEASILSQGEARLEIKFRTKKLEKCYLDHQQSFTQYGKEVGRKYIQRINIIKEAISIHELKGLPGLRCHPLKGDRKGQWAVKLTNRYRLIFTLEGERLEIAHIEEVSNHYDD